jgi:hypothetical protein
VAALVAGDETKEARLELNGERWQLSELSEFKLTPIPPKAEPEPEPPSRTFLVRYFDGREETVELASGMLQGTVYDLGPDHGLGWAEGRTWSARLEDVDTLERVQELAEALR